MTLTLNLSSKTKAIFVVLVAALVLFAIFTPRFSEADHAFVCAFWRETGSTCEGELADPELGIRFTCLNSVPGVDIPGGQDNCLDSDDGFSTQYSCNSCSNGCDHTADSDGVLACFPVDTEDPTISVSISPVSPDPSDVVKYLVEVTDNLALKWIAVNVDGDGDGISYELGAFRNISGLSASEEFEFGQYLPDTTVRYQIVVADQAGNQAVIEDSFTVSEGASGKIEVTSTSCDLSDPPCDFGSIFVGSFIDYRFTVKNTGTADLSGSLSIISEHFSDVTSGGCDYNLAIEATKACKIRFEPLSRNSKGATASFAGGGGFGISLIGLGVDSGVIADFTTDEDPPAITAGESIQFRDASGGNPTSWLWDFGDEDTTDNDKEDPNHQYLSEGIFNVSLTVENDAEDKDTETKNNYVVVGSGSTDLTLTPKPDSFDFGDVMVGNTLNHRFTLTNNKAGSVGGALTVSFPFTCINNTCNYALDGEESKQIFVKFTPSEPGPKSSPVGAGGADMNAVTLSGNGVAPVCRVDGSVCSFNTDCCSLSCSSDDALCIATDFTIAPAPSITFPDTVEGQQSLKFGHKFTITNNTGKTVTFSSVSFIGKDLSSFKFDPAPNYADIPHNETRDVWVVFRPQDTGSLIASVRFDTGQGTFTRGVNGNGISSDGGGLPQIIEFLNPLGVGSLSEVIEKVASFLFTIALIIAPILLVVAGVIFMTAAGDPNRISSARRMLIWTVIGFTIILLSRGLIAVLKSILGAS